MNLQMEINSLKQRIAELEQQAKEEQEFPQYGDTYWCINTYGGVSKETRDGFKFEKDMLTIGNVFQTENEAEFAVEKLKVEAELRKFSRKFIWGGENWILSMGTNKDIFLVYEDDEMNQGAVYFEDEYKALEAIEAVGKERIKKYIFGVED